MEDNFGGPFSEVTFTGGQSESGPQTTPSASMDTSRGQRLPGKESLGKTN